MAELTAQRLDKWLWAARFFKTRALAVDAIKGGKVQLNGQRSKPAKDIQVGAELEIHKGQIAWNITVTGLSKNRVSATLAQALFDEDPASHSRRQELTAQLRAERAAAGPVSARRPNKKDRRLIHRFKRA